MYSLYTLCICMKEDFPVIVVWCLMWFPSAPTRLGFWVVKRGDLRMGLAALYFVYRGCKTGWVGFIIGTGSLFQFLVELSRCRRTHIYIYMYITYTITHIYIYYMCIYNILYVYTRFIGEAWAGVFHQQHLTQLCLGSLAGTIFARNWCLKSGAGF